MVTNRSICKQAKAVFLFFCACQKKMFFLSDVGFGEKRERSFEEDPDLNTLATVAAGPAVDSKIFCQRFRNVLKQVLF